MCLAVLKPEGKSIPKAHIVNSWENGNSHGAGFAVAVKGTLIVDKGFSTVEELWDAFARYNTGKYRAMVHLRFATHGPRGADGCHPFLLPDGAALIHNGIIPGSKAGEHDTASYIRRVLSKLPATWYKSKVYCDLVGAHIGEHNKLVILDGGGRGSVINAKSGVRRDGIWYSNTSFEKPKPVDTWFRWKGSQGFLLGDSFESKPMARAKGLHDMTDADWDEYMAAKRQTWSAES